MSPLDASLKLRPATADDLPGLADNWYEAFHPASEFMRQAIPDTPLVRKFWDATNEYSMNDPFTYLLVVADSSTDPERIAAHLRFSTSPPLPASKLDAGVWSRIPWSADQNAELCHGAVDFMIKGRRKTMANIPHAIIESVGTSKEYSGRGAAGMLLKEVCKIADEQGIAVFVETNTVVVGFYEKFGFKVKDRLLMPGGTGYEEFILVRSAKPKA